MRDDKQGVLLLLDRQLDVSPRDELGSGVVAGFFSRFPSSTMGLRLAVVNFSLGKAPPCGCLPSFDKNTLEGVYKLDNDKDRMQRSSYLVP